MQVWPAISHVSHRSVTQHKLIMVGAIWLCCRLFTYIMDHALNLKTPAFSMKLPTSIGSIFPPACRARI